MARIMTAQVSRRVFDAKLKRTQRILTSPTAEMARSLRSHFKRSIRPEYLRILHREMSPDAELDVLNRGWVVRKGGEIFALPAISTRVVGSSEGGRFIHASFTPVTVAVAKENVEIDSTYKHGLRVGAVNAERVNEATSFRWSMRDKKGRFRAQGKTRPFGMRYIQVLETGGVLTAPDFGKIKRRQFRQIVQAKGITKRGNRWVWTVKHRTPGKRLWPEEGVFVWQVEKTIQPLQMFRRALFNKTPAAMEGWISDLTRHLIGTIRFSAPRGAQISLF